MDTSIFRKVSLERLSSPEQLDQLLTITSLRAWVALAAVGIFLFALLVWSIFGSIATPVYGTGMIMKYGGLISINAKEDGVLQTFYANLGDKVKKGDCIAVIAEPELVDQIESNERMINELEGQIKTVKERFEKQKNLLQQGLITTETYATTRQELSSLTLRMQDLKGNNAILSDRLVSASKILAPDDGIILEIDVKPGTFVTKGTPLAHLELKGNRMQAVLYFSAGEGKRIRKGMQAHISPSVAAQEQYGYMKGTVWRVSDFPVSKYRVMYKLGTEMLAKMVMSDAAPIEVVVDLIPDPHTPSGYVWSSKRGPNMHIYSGTMCVGTVTVFRQSPISLVIPLFKKYIFGIGENHIIKQGTNKL